MRNTPRPRRVFPLCYHYTHVMVKNLLFQQKLVKAVSNLVEKDELVAWSRMKEERREHTITKLLHTVEESALTLAGNYKTPTELEIKATEMGEKMINTERSHRHYYIKLSCHSLPPGRRKVRLWIIVIFIVLIPSLPPSFPQILDASFLFLRCRAESLHF